MPHKHKVLVLAAVIVTLLALGVSQLQAQSPLTLEGLSERISALAGTVSTLRRNSATKTEVRALRGRVATLEARFDETPLRLRSRPRRRRHRNQRRQRLQRRSQRQRQRRRRRSCPRRRRRRLPLI